MNKLGKRHLTMFLLCIVASFLFCPQTILAESNGPYITQKLESEKSIIFKKDTSRLIDKQGALVKRNALIESDRGRHTKASANFYFSDLSFDLGEIVSENASFDKKGRPINSNQIINDAANPNVSQQRLLSNIEYNEIDKPISYKEELFITAKDYLTDNIVRLLSTMDVYEIKYNDEGKPITILGNTEVAISDDKGDNLLNIKGSFTKRARCDINGKIIRYDRYGIDNIVVANGAGEIIITAPPSITDTQNPKEYRVGIVNIKDEQRLREVLNHSSFINQLLAKLGLVELFYKAFYTEKFYTSLTYLQIENTPEEIMSLQNITAAFKNLIEERQKAYALFQNDVDAYYDSLAKILFEHTELWWHKDIKPQEYYAGNDKILSKQEYRKMVDDAIISLSLRTNHQSPQAPISQQILFLEQYLRTQMLMNSKLIYIQNLKNAVSQMDKEASLAMRKLDRPVLIHEKGTIEALIALPEKKKK